MGGTQPLQESDLIFPNAASGLRDALGELKRSHLTISNRLRSIKQDAEFVKKIAEACQLPLIANERCGSWYVAPEHKAGGAYFKSTDGHNGQWAFSLRRLNVQILDIIGKGGGCIIVDSTRRGKSMPDALSKTVPIWVAVLNRLLFPEHVHFHRLQTPETVVSPSEHAQIEQRLPAFVRDAALLGLNLDDLRANLRYKPMRPHWVTSRTQPPQWSSLQSTDAHAVVLCTASSSESTDLHASAHYVQGAADDSESWACGLDAATYWNHVQELLSTSEDTLSPLIVSLVADKRNLGCLRTPVLIAPTVNIFIGNNAALKGSGKHFHIIVTCTPAPLEPVAEKSKQRHIVLHCSTGKVGSRQLRTELPKVEELANILDPDSRVLVTCDNGKDQAVGVALAIICMFFQDDGWMKLGLTSGDHYVPNKAEIKQRLSWIMVSMPDAAPSRATLQSVNAFLMG